MCPTTGSTGNLQNILPGGRTTGRSIIAGDSWRWLISGWPTWTGKSSSGFARLIGDERSTCMQQLSDKRRKYYHTRSYGDTANVSSLHPSCLANLYTSPAVPAVSATQLVVRVTCIIIEMLAACRISRRNRIHVLAIYAWFVVKFSTLILTLIWNSVREPTFFSTFCSLKTRFLHFELAYQKLCSRSSVLNSWK